MTLNENALPVHAALLPFLGVLRIGGADAARFLQGQLTNDVQLLADGRTQLTACNTPQGRVIALLRLHQGEDAIYALLPTEMLERVSALLRRYVLRSRVELQIAADLQVGWTRAMTASPGAAATHKVAFDYAPGRQVVAVPHDAWRSMSGLPSTLPRPRIQDAWLAADIADGLPQVFAATSAAFVPQMLNLDLLDAISFTKGCYTGQEIVARTQNLGRIKRRTLRYRLAAGAAPPPLAGLHRDGTRVAEVLMSAEHDGAVELLAVTNLDAAGQALTLEDGRIAEPQELPYRTGG
jgi:hypothetical protein